MQFKHLFLTITFLLNLLLASFAQEPTLLEHGGGVRTVEFSPADSQLVASAGESNIIKLWNLRNNTARTLNGHTGRVNSVIFSPNGELLASVSDDSTLRLWNVQRQQNIATRNVTDRYLSVDFSPDEQMLVTGGGRHVTLWNAQTLTEIDRLPLNHDVRTVDFSSEDGWLAAGDDSGTVTVWDVKSRRVFIRLNANPKNVKAVEFSPHSLYLAASGWNGHLKVWDVSTWDLLFTIPNVGHYDLAFSHDEEWLASTGNGYVGLWATDDGSSVGRLPGPTDWIHPIDFSHDGTSLAVGAEDGILRIWDIHTSATGNGKDAGVRILNVDTYLQQLPKANSVSGGNIPEPAPLPAVVRDYFQLDPFYQQWIDVGGFPVIASAKVNPYALKEAAWLIDKMIGHRQDLLQALIKNKVRFTVIGYTEMTTQIPEYSHRRPAFYWDRRQRGSGGSAHSAVSCTEENLLAYRGDTAPNGFQLIHEFAHIIHHAGLNTVTPQFDNRLKIAYDAAMKQRLWQGSYASTNRDEYWAEGTHAWIDPKGGSSFKRVHGGNTRAELKQYDPKLAMLLTEIYGDRNWRYTPIATRTHLPHLRGFNPQDSPTFRWPQRLEEAYAQLRDPSINRGEEWINLKPYNPNQLSQLIKSQTSGNRTHVLIVNLAEFDVLVYQGHPDGAETFKRRIPAKRGLRHAEIINTQVGSIYLVKDQNGRSIAVFRAEAETGRILIGTASNNASPVAQEDVSRNDSQPQVLIAESQRPPLYWVDTVAGTLHRLVGAKVESLLPSVQNATSLAVDMVDEKLYWTEKMSDRTGRIRRANLNGRNVQLVKNLTSLPLDIALDTTNGTLYLTNAWGKIQRLNVNGSNFQPNFIIGLDTPGGLTLDVSGGKVYWTEMSGRIRCANLDGSNVQDVATGLGTLMNLVVFDGSLYWTEKTGENRGEIQFLALDSNTGDTIFNNTFTDGFPVGIGIDAVENKLYWTTSNGKIGRLDLDSGDFQSDIVTGLGIPSAFAVAVEMPVEDETTEIPTTDTVLSISPSLVISPTVGEKLTLSLNIAAAEAVAGYQATVQFDTTALRFVTGENGDFLPADAFFVQPKVEGNLVKLNAASAAESNGDGTLATLTFEVIVVKASTLVLSDVLLSNEAGEGAIPQVESAEITKPTRLKGDVNADGIVNIQDLVLVASNLGQTGQNDADVNNDRLVNIQDLVLVAGALGTSAAAPSLYPQLLQTFTAADAHQWLSQAQSLDLTDTTTQQGIHFLEALLTMLTPKETVLLPNYPNPFNPETWIPYQLAEPAKVTLHIYTVNGRLIRTLTLGHQLAGMYQRKSRATYWDGRNAFGEPVASGLYFYTFTAGDFTATRKMLIRK